MTNITEPRDWHWRNPDIVEFEIKVTWLANYFEDEDNEPSPATATLELVEMLREKLKDGSILVNDDVTEDLDICAFRFSVERHTA